jgi:hypothetical protein
MARAIHADLIAKQSTDIQPYIRCIFTARGGSPTYDYSFDPTVNTNRLELVEHHEEPYFDYGTIEINNYDHSIPALKGYYVDLVYGANTATGLKDTTDGVFPRLWVKGQNSISMQGQLKTILQLYGAWRIMLDIPVRIGDAPYFDGWYKSGEDHFCLLDGKTRYGVIEYLMGRLTAETGYGFTLNALGDQDDGIINTDIINIGTFEEPGPDLPGLDSEANPITYAAYIANLMGDTKCFLRVNNGLYFTVIYPQSEDAVKETYYSNLNGGHVFYDNNDAEVQVIPNHIIVYGNQDPITGDWDDMITSDAYNPADFTESPPELWTYTGPYMEVVRVVIRGEETTVARCEAIAAAHLTHVRSEVTGGRVIVPHDARVELYDRVQIVDTR